MPLVIAHRGASRARPPGNTVEAFEEAGRLGADWVELDVRRTADGALAVHHDADLADGRSIVGLQRAELPPMVPTLTEAVTACDGLGVNIEIKNSPDDAGFDPSRRLSDLVVEFLEGRDRSRFLVTSFDIRSLDRVRALDATIRTGVLSAHLDDLQKVIDLTHDRGHVALNPWDGWVTAELMERATAAQLEVNVWTVNDPDRMRVLADLGVDGIITDTPDVLRGVLDAAG